MDVDVEAIAENLSPRDDLRREPVPLVLASPPLLVPRTPEFSATFSSEATIEYRGTR